MKTNASPRVLVIASGAIRCTHIIKGLHSIADGSPVRVRPGRNGTNDPI